MMPGGSVIAKCQLPEIKVQLNTVTVWQVGPKRFIHLEGGDGI
jgi:hypothetical protein